MKRKIVQHGPSTLIISLPSAWVKLHNVRKGDELDVREEGKDLIIGSSTNNFDYSMSGDVSAFQPYLIDQFLSRAYQKGYDGIRLVHNSPEILKAIQEKNKELMGFEITEQNNNYCVIQSLSQRIELDFDNSLRKGFLIVKMMLETCLKAYNDNDKPALKKYLS